MPTVMKIERFQHTSIYEIILYLSHFKPITICEYSEMWVVFLKHIIFPKNMKYNYVSIFFKQRPLLLKITNRYPVFHIPTRTCVVIDRNCRNLKEWRKLIKQMYWSIINYLLISESFFFNANKMNSNSDLNIPSPQCGPLNPARQWHSPLIQRPLPLQFGTSHSFSGTLHSWPFHPWLQWHTPPMYCPLPLHTTGQSPETHDIVITWFTRYRYHTVHTLYHHMVHTWYCYHTVHILYRYHTTHTLYHYHMAHTLYRYHTTHTLYYAFSL